MLSLSSVKRQEMGAAHLSKETTKATIRLQPTWNLNTGAYETLMPWIRAENLKALNAVRFSQPHAMGVGVEPQYLDIGCGPGSFTKEALLPGVRPACNRLVAVDRCSRVLDYARENFSHRRIVYDVMEIERDDPECLMERYGGFNRVYSFLTFHYVVDIAKAYDNIRKLLKRGGECLVLSIVRADAVDVWNEAYQMDEWNSVLINPSELFPGMVHSSESAKSAVELEAHTRDCISAAGLECLVYYRYDSRWVFGRIEDYLDAFMFSFQVYEGVPLEKQVALRDVWMNLLCKRTGSVLGRECAVKYTFSVVHARKTHKS